MQGNKEYQEKLFVSFQLSQVVPEHNFYRRLKSVLNLDFLLKETESYYGNCGQKSIDPRVFFKLCIVGYLENIISDRKLIEHCSMRLDILYFLGYDIDEPLPWHSTVSRTRQLFPEDIFEKVFTQIFKLCVDSGLVSGHTQATDAAPIKANASMDSLELKVPEEELEEHLSKIRAISHGDQQPVRKAKKDKAQSSQRKVSATKDELNEIAARQKKWSTEQTTRQGAKSKRSKYTSNKTHYSPTDPDARISVKPGKARKLNYHGNITVDTSHNIISDVQAYHADRVDSKNLQDIVERTKNRLTRSGLLWTTILADAGYSSGENYHFLEDQKLVSYIPKHGTFKGGPEGFTFVKDQNYWICPQGIKVVFKKQKYSNDSLQNHYYTKRSDCKNCPQKKACIGKSFEKKIAITAYLDEYHRNNKRVNSWFGKRMKGKRQATVEPAWGTLTQFLGLRKINTLGLKQANKVVHMAACAYNLKKLLKYSISKIESQAMTPKANILTKYALLLAFLDSYGTFLRIITRATKMRIQLSIL
ncbi:IS1182 family transposase [Carboxylicivirga linearis]|uniref:IS1182 family transposase n=1 Tax=Carboxylicivirga linearis TaxID=1628157 RepID=A0ABS5JVC7_9BACT|nr:IS1182 family transposase [Carboxylicivirga linearis]MBS2098865.1 IS1182 family transposase [Carboxylicivirga linearis]